MVSSVSSDVGRDDAMSDFEGGSARALLLNDAAVQVVFDTVAVRCGEAARPEQHIRSKTKKKLETFLDAFFPLDQRLDDFLRSLALTLCKLSKPHVPQWSTWSWVQAGSVEGSSPGQLLPACHQRSPGRSGRAPFS